MPCTVNYYMVSDYNNLFGHREITVQHLYGIHILYNIMLTDIWKLACDVI